MIPTSLVIAVAQRARLVNTSPRSRLTSENSSEELLGSQPQVVGSSPAQPGIPHEASARGRNPRPSLRTSFGRLAGRVLAFAGESERRRRVDWDDGCRPERASRFRRPSRSLPPGSGAQARASPPRWPSICVIRIYVWNWMTKPGPVAGPAMADTAPARARARAKRVRRAPDPGGDGGGSRER
jgi:hypothetical protein